MNPSLYLLTFVICFLTLYRNTLGVKKANFQVDNLKCHNKYRSKHGVSNLTYTPELQKAAQRYANELAAQDQGLDHEKGAFYGENLFSTSAIEVKGTDACEAWYKESSKYDYSKKDPKNFMEVGHFTQMVWKDTKATGIGLATAKSGMTYIVAKYSPTGNFIGDYKHNVLKPK